MRFTRGFALAVIIAIILVVAIVYLLQPKRPRETTEEPLKGKQGGPLREMPYQEPPERYDTERREEKIPFLKKQKVSIIIDDIGYNLAPLNELLEIDAPITFAILPHLPHSVDAAEILYREGREILLHLPMEPKTYPEEKPGSGALFLWMNEDQIRQQVEEDLDAVPYIVGVNNHMGSRFMEDRTKLSVVLQQIKERGLFFVDSLTTRYSKGRELAKEIGLRFAARDVFIDNGRDYKATFQILMDLWDKRNPQKMEIVIVSGHPYPSTVRALKEAVPLLKAKGIDIVPVSELLEMTGKKTTRED
ncbi:MAG: divergent polysaccharide deacetylase family protein [Syntrophales bacterium]|nr:divergent polysaccharide deacetylase family protein [Syntrophales bacterium]